MTRFRILNTKVRNDKPNGHLCTGPFTQVQVTGAVSHRKVKFALHPYLFEESENAWGMLEVDPGREQCFTHEYVSTGSEHHVVRLEFQGSGAVELQQAAAFARSNMNKCVYPDQFGS